MELYARATPHTNTGFTLGVYHQNDWAPYEHTIRFLWAYNFYKLWLTVNDIVLAQKYFDRKCRELYIDNKNIHECYDKIMDLCREYGKHNFEN